jgi:hypothetical protein
VLLNVAAHNISIRKVKVSKREHHITYSVTKCTASQNAYVMCTLHVVMVYVLWRCTLCDIYVLKTLGFGTLTLSAATFCNIISCDTSVNQTVYPRPPPEPSGLHYCTCWFTLLYLWCSRYVALRYVATFFLTLKGWLFYVDLRHFHTYTVRHPPRRLECPKMHTQCQIPVGSENY